MYNGGFFNKPSFYSVHEGVVWQTEETTKRIVDIPNQKD